jgi:hypothetical protein
VQVILAGWNNFRSMVRGVEIQTMSSQQQSETRSEG